MPNCDFYAADEDFRGVMQFVFEELDCRVFESYSPIDEEIMEFQSFDELSSARSVGHCQGDNQSLYLQLWPTKASENVRVRRIDLDQRRFKGGRFRYNIEGWGLIQLYLGGRGEQGLVHSHTNHNSEKRALNWASTNQDQLGDPAAWDWAVVSGTSRRLNRFIRKAALSKLEHARFCRNRLGIPKAVEL